MAKILLAIELNDNENIEEVLKNLNVGENTDTDIVNCSKFSNDEILLTPKDIISYLKVRSDTVYDLFKESDFPGYKINGKYKVGKDLFLKYIDSHYGNKKVCKIK